MSILKAMLQGKRSWRESMLASDGYKWPMMAGGRFTEEEVFYLSFRKGYLFVPMDLEQMVRDLIPNPSVETVREELALLREWGFNVTARMLWDSVDGSRLKVIYAIPQGEWAAPREPVMTVKGPQAITSWLEPLVIGQASYMMQVATAYIDACMTGKHDEFLARIAVVTCQRQKELTLEAIRGTYTDPTAEGTDEEIDFISERIRVDEQAYYEAVQEQGRKLLATGVTPERIFEVGLRAATCMEQHLIALKALKDIGLTLTSNAYGAYVLGTKAVGTLGHEGIMRWGAQDELAFRKHIAAMPLTIMLLDTNDTLKVGLPTALKLMEEFPDRNDGVRPDSGSLEEQFRVFVSEINRRGIRPRPWVFEDGLDDKDMAHYEALTEELEYPKEVTLYGLGGYFIDRPEPTGFRRGLISMIYKLAWTESFGPAMKFGNEVEEGASGKQSIPGMPVLAVPEDEGKHPETMVCQHNNLPPGWRLFSTGDSRRRRALPERPYLCAITQGMIHECKQARRRAIEAA